MSTYICKCGRRVKKSTNADNTGNRLEGYGPGHECYGCPYILSWGNYEWKEDAQKITLNVKGYECRMSPMLSYNSEFIGSTKDKCTCSVVSLDFDFLEQISSWVKKTFTSGELTGYFSRGEIRATDYCHNGRYQYTLCCAQNKKGIAAKAALFEHFFNSGGSRKDMTPQQEMEKVLTDIRKAKEATECATAPNADAAVTTAENAVLNAATATPTTSESEEDASALTPVTSLQTCESAPAASADGSSVSMPSAPGFDFSPLGDLAGAAADADHQFDLHYGTAQDEYLISCIYLARVHALTAKAGRYGGGTWTKWYESKGLSHGSATKMVQNGDAFKSSTVDELKCLPELTRKDLNLIARSGCAEQLTATAGDSQRVQELLAQIKAKDDAIAAEKERADAAEAREEEAWKLQSKSEAKAKDAETELEAVTADLNGLYDRAAQAEARNTALLDERAEYVQRIKELESRPIEVMHDPEETDRLAHQYAYGIAADMTEELRTKNNQQSQTIAALQKELEAARSTNGYDPQSDLETVCACIGSMEQMWGTALPAYERLSGKDLRTATDTLQDVIGRLYGDMARTAEDGED